MEKLFLIKKRNSPTHYFFNVLKPFQLKISNKLFFTLQFDRFVTQNFQENKEIINFYIIHPCELD